MMNVYAHLYKTDRETLNIFARFFYAWNLTNETVYFWSGKQVQYYLHILDYIISLYMNILKLKFHFISTHNAKCNNSAHIA